MATIDPISAQTVCELFLYDADTGMVTRRVESGSRAPAGAVVGSDDAYGYKTVRIQRRSYKLHRVIWLYVHGDWPTGDVDHINGLRSDNRIANLRDVPRSKNLQNCRVAPGHSTTGLLGVHRAKGGKFASKISIQNRNMNLGTFDTPEEAQAAYLAAKQGLHPGFVALHHDAP